jgi:1-phosphatidylinositol-4-phosphate 5-kinase
MPTFLADDNSPIFSANSDILDLDPNNHFGLGANDRDKSKINGDPALRQRSNTINESFDESSNSSTHVSDLSDATPVPLNGGTRPTSMSSLPNGKSVARGTEERDSRHLQNGASMILTDRTVGSPSPLANGSKEADDMGTSPTETYPKRTSISSVAAGSIQQSPIEFYQKPAKGGSVSAVDGAAPGLNPSSSSAPATGFVTPAPSLTPASPSPDPNKRGHSPHRFSSPPLPTGSASSSLYPGNVGALKHRHTLEVPKLQPGRQSRDGLDTAYSSGRFSPTTATSGVRRASLSLVRRNTKSMQSDFPRDEILPDEDALRWAEAYRQKRASKRKRREVEDDDRVLVGTKVDEHHANWVTAYNMLTGIRVSVSRTNAKLDRALTDADFEAKQKSTFDIAGNELVPSAKYDFKFKDYAPWVFRHLRALFRLDPADYLMSLTGKYILSELGSPGKSGSFFYFSRDYKYIIKTIHHAEHKFLRKILKDYYNHVTENPNTLLSQFYGLHRVKMPYGKKIHFVVMNNLFPPHRDIHQTFDLKGSTIGRDYHEEDLEKNPRATLKDLNWLRREKHLELGIQKKRLFLEQLHRDVVLLKRLQIMDYSLLVGIHDLERGNEENLRDKTLKVFNPGGEQQAPDDLELQSVLLRTPSKLENARKARELRQMIRQERPIPMGQSASRMPNELEEGQNRPDFVWTRDDGGFRATHEDNTPADEIYYLGVIDCLTHVSDCRFMNKSTGLT